MRTSRTIAVAMFSLAVFWPQVSSGDDAIVPTCPHVQKYSKIESNEGFFLKRNIRVVCLNKAPTAAEIAHDVGKLIEERTRLRVKVQRTLPKDKTVATIIIGLEKDIPPAVAPREELGGSQWARKKGYVLRIEANRVVIAGASLSGLREAVRTFAQLVRNDVVLPSVLIEDWPDFSDRILVLDGESDLTAANLPVLAEKAAAIKLNVFGVESSDWFDSSPAAQKRLKAWLTALGAVHLRPGLIWPSPEDCHLLLIAEPLLAKTKKTVETILLVQNETTSLSHPNVVLREGCPLVVRLKDGRELKAGTDYKIVKGTTAYPFDQAGQRWGIHLKRNASLPVQVEAVVQYSYAPQGTQVLADEAYTWSTVSRISKRIGELAPDATAFVRLPALSTDERPNKEIWLETQKYVCAISKGAKRVFLLTPVKDLMHREFCAWLATLPAEVGLVFAARDDAPEDLRQWTLNRAIEIRRRLLLGTDVFDAELSGAYRWIRALCSRPQGQRPMVSGLMVRIPQDSLSAPAASRFAMTAEFAWSSKTPPLDAVIAFCEKGRKQGIESRSRTLRDLVKHVAAIFNEAILRGKNLEIPLLRSIRRVDAEAQLKRAYGTDLERLATFNPVVNNLLARMKQQRTAAEIWRTMAAWVRARRAALTGTGDRARQESERFLGFLRRYETDEQFVDLADQTANALEGAARFPTCFDVFKTRVLCPLGKLKDQGTLIRIVPRRISCTSEMPEHSVAFIDDDNVLTTYQPRPDDSDPFVQIDLGMSMPLAGTEIITGPHQEYNLQSYRVAGIFANEPERLLYESPLTPAGPTSLLPLFGPTMVEKVRFLLDSCWGMMPDVAEIHCYALVKPKAISIPRTAVPPDIDGQLVENVWASESRLEHFLVDRPGEPRLAFPQTYARCAYDDRALYVAVWCQEPEMETVVQGSGEQEKPDPTSDAINIIFKRQETGWFVLRVEAGGRTVDWLQKSRFDAPDYSWSSEARTATGSYGAGWSVEIEIPLVNVELKPIEGHRFYANIKRDRPRAGLSVTSYWRSSTEALPGAYEFGQISFGTPVSR